MPHLSQTAVSTPGASTDSVKEVHDHEAVADGPPEPLKKTTTSSTDTASKEDESSGSPPAKKEEDKNL